MLTLAQILGPRPGLVSTCDIVQKTPRELQLKATRLVAGKCALLPCSPLLLPVVFGVIVTVSQYRQHYELAAVNFLLIFGQRSHLSLNSNAIHLFLSMFLLSFPFLSLLSSSLFSHLCSKDFILCVRLLTPSLHLSLPCLRLHSHSHTHTLTRRVALAARADSQQSGTTTGGNPGADESNPFVEEAVRLRAGKVGEELRAKVESAIEHWLEPPPLQAQKALKIPGGKIRKHRGGKRCVDALCAPRCCAPARAPHTPSGGEPSSPPALAMPQLLTCALASHRRMRRLNERLAQTEVRKQLNRVAFGGAEEVDPITGQEFGMLGSKDAMGKLVYAGQDRGGGLFPSLFPLFLHSSLPCSLPHCLSLTLSPFRHSSHSHSSCSQSSTFLDIECSIPAFPLSSASPTSSPIFIRLVITPSIFPCVHSPPCLPVDSSTVCLLLAADVFVRTHRNPEEVQAACCAAAAREHACATAPVHHRGRGDVPQTLHGTRHRARPPRRPEAEVHGRHRIGVSRC